jgi:hypothetical protein
MIGQLRSEVLKAANIKINGVPERDAMRFGRTFCFHVQGRTFGTYQNTRCHILEHRNNKMMSE